MNVARRGSHTSACVSIRQHTRAYELEMYARVCFTITKVQILTLMRGCQPLHERMLAYAGVCCRMLTYADECWRMLTLTRGCQPLHERRAPGLQKHLRDACRCCTQFTILSLQVLYSVYYSQFPTRACWARHVPESPI